jgi:hypothetical protein
MPTLHSPGVRMPGQLGPIIRTPFSSSSRRAAIMSSVGMPSVITTTSFTPALTASAMASPQNAAGTKMHEVSAPVSRTAGATVSKIGTASSNFVPPLPGVTPATTFVP